MRPAAIRDWLDRAGVNAKTESEITVVGCRDVIHEGVAVRARITSARVET